MSTCLFWVLSKFKVSQKAESDQTPFAIWMTEIFLKGISAAIQMAEHFSTQITSAVWMDEDIFKQIATIIQGAAFFQMDNLSHSNG